MITITISGEQHEFIKDDLRIMEPIDERSTCKFTITDWPGDKIFYRGQPVAIHRVKDEEPPVPPVLIFGGVIEKARRTRRSTRSEVLHSINCVDWHYLLDKRIVARAYLEQTAGAIITSIHTDYLAEEGITLGQIDQGHVMEEAVFNYTPASRAIGTLKEAQNFWFKINPDKSLDFLNPTHYVYPDTITWDDIIGEPVLEEGNNKYRNRQWVRGATDLTGVQIERKSGNGLSRDFNLGYRAGAAPTFKVSRAAGPYLEERRGIKGLDQGESGIVNTSGTTVTRVSGNNFIAPGWNGLTININGINYTIDTVTDPDTLTLTTSAGAQSAVAFLLPRWYWEKFSETVNLDYAAPVLAEGDILEISYQGIVDIIIRTQDVEAIYDRQALEGFGTGLVEEVTNSGFSERQAAFDFGASLLAKYSKQGSTVKFKTLKEGMRAGQLLTINLPEYYVANKEMLIENIEIFCTSPTELGYAVTAVEGPTHGSWTRFFGTIFDTENRYIIRDNITEVEVLLLLFEFSKAWSPEPPLNNILKQTFPGPAVYPAADLYPMFDYQDRITHVEWQVGGTSHGRKPLTDKQDMETQIIKTFAYLAPFEGNGLIEEIHWYGGIDATNNQGTGIKVVSETFNQDKSSAEGWDIRRTDRWDI